MVGSGALTSARSSSSDVQFDKNSPLGKLGDDGEKMEERSKEMEGAGKAGDTKAEAGAAVEGLGALLGGGKRVDPIGIDQLKPLVPETFGGLPKISSSADKSGIAGFMVSKAEARYGDGAGKTVTLEISDTGGVSGIMALAGWAGIEGESEDDNGSERTQKVNGRLTHEKTSKTGGTNEFAVVLLDPLVVSGQGNGGGGGTLQAPRAGP